MCSSPMKLPSISNALWYEYKQLDIKTLWTHQAHVLTFCKMFLPFGFIKSTSFKNSRCHFRLWKNKEKRHRSRSFMCLIIGSWNKVCIVKSCKVPCNGCFPNEEQLVFLIWQLIALCTLWKTLTPLALDDINFVVIYALETLPCLFKASMITLARLFA